jgi:thiol-disulfide isomerase/thioredoxin
MLQDRMTERRRAPPVLSVVVALALLSSVAVAAGPGGGETHPFGGHAWLGISMERGATAKGASEKGASEKGGAEKGATSSSGVHVKHVLRGSPADKAGVKEGDFIRAIDGANVASPDDVSRIVAGHDPGEAVVASLSRAADVLSIKIPLAARPSADEMLRMDRVGAFAPSWVGVEPVGDAPPSLGALRGKVVLLDFWATWCGPCRLLAPKLSAMQTRYGAQGLRVVGVTTDAPEKAALFAQRVSMRYPVTIDRRGETSQAYDVSALPTLFVIDKRGVVRDVAVGYDEGREAQIETLLQTLLAEPAPPELAPAAPAPADRGE